MGLLSYCKQSGIDPGHQHTNSSITSSTSGNISLVFPAIPLFSQSASALKEPSPHITRFISVDRSVKLEVLDWSGSGRSLVLLAGGGDTAHGFNDFAPKLIDHHQVYGSTRRGFGASGFSTTEHPADRLGDDALAVIDSLKLNRAVLVRHSIAGAELSSVANSHPDRVAGLIYLEAAYSYALTMAGNKHYGSADLRPAGRIWPASVHYRTIMSA